MERLTAQTQRRRGLKISFLSVSLWFRNFTAEIQAYGEKKYNQQFFNFFLTDFASLRELLYWTAAKLRSGS
jgi:hypothetical protein